MEERGYIFFDCFQIRHEPSKEVHRDVKHGNNKAGINKNDQGKDSNNKRDDKNAKTKIPVSHFRQTVERVKTKQRGSKELESETQIPIRRSSLPKTNNKAPVKPARKSISVSTIKVAQPELVQEDDFDKLYEEVVHNNPTPINIDVSLLDPKVEDPEKLESKFEEIIHDYDENRVQPIDVEKIKKSKIPFFKRNSQPEMNVGDRRGKMIAARDKARMRHNSAKPDEFNYVRTEEIISNDQVEDKTDNKASEISSTASEETSSHIGIVPSSNDNEKDESRKVFGATIVAKMKPHDDGRIREENICKNYIKIGIPVFESYVSENTEKDENKSPVEVADKPSYTTGSDSLANEEIEAIESVVPEVIDNAEQSITEVVEMIENLSDIESENTNTGILSGNEQIIGQNIEIDETENAIDVTDEPTCISENNELKMNKIESSFEVIEINNKPITSEVVDNTEESVIKSVETSKTSFDTEPVLNENEQKIEQNINKNETENVEEITDEISYTQNNIDSKIDNLEAKIEAVEANNEPVSSEESNDLESSLIEAVEMREISFDTESVLAGNEKEIKVEPDTEKNETENVLDVTDEMSYIHDNADSIDNIETRIEEIEVNSEPIVPKVSDHFEPSFIETRATSLDTDPVLAKNEQEIQRREIFEINITENTLEARNKPSYTTDSNDFKVDEFEAKIKAVDGSNEPELSAVSNNAKQNIIEIVETKVLSFVYEPVIAENAQEIQIGLASEINVTENTVEVTGEPSTADNDDSKLDRFEDSVNAIEINNKAILPEVGDDMEQSKVEADDTLEASFDPIPAENKQEIEDTTALVEERYDNLENTAQMMDHDILISKIDIPEPTKAHKNAFSNDLPKKKSVLSKIAMFERNEEKPITSKIPKKNTTLPITSNKQTENVHVHTPLIVDEVFKPFEHKIISKNVRENHIENITNDRDVPNIVRAEMALVESPETVQYGIEDKVQIEPNTMFIQHSIVSEEVLKPMPIRHEPKSNENDRKTRFKDKYEDTPVVVPKFIPVKEALKRYESLKTNDTRVNHKNLENLPKTRPIHDIIKTLKPEKNPRSLDTMFAHQVTPVSDILKDIKPDTYKDKTYKTQKSNGDFNKPRVEELQIYDKTKHGFKSFKSGGYDYKTFENEDNNFKTLQFIQDYNKIKNEELKRAKSVAELDLGDAVKGKVSRMIVRINSLEKIEMDTKEVPISLKEMPIRRSVSEKIALFERKSTTTKEVSPPIKQNVTEMEDQKQKEITADIQAKIAELTTARLKYGKMAPMPRIQLANGVSMPVIAVGTALLDPRLTYHIVTAAIDLGYRAIDTAFIYGNEKVVGEAINAKIKDGTVTREELFVTSKLWSTFHRTDLVVSACDASLTALGLDYFDLYLIHNPMSFKEGASPIPKIATVLQYSESDYLDAWFGMESLGSRVRAIGVSNFNSTQIKRVLDRARVKPVVNQVECHPYLSQQKLDDYCSERNITLNCFGVLGSKGTPAEYKSGLTACIDDPLLQVMASGLNVSPAQLLIRYQFECGHTVVVKSSTAAHLWDNLQALTFNMTSAQIDALHALNRNKRTFTFKGMGDTHKNYPFNTLF